MRTKTNHPTPGPLNAGWHLHCWQREVGATRRFTMSMPIMVLIRIPGQENPKHGNQSQRSISSLLSQGTPFASRGEVNGLGSLKLSIRVHRSYQSPIRHTARVTIRSLKIPAGKMNRQYPQKSSWVIVEHFLVRNAQRAGISLTKESTHNTLRNNESTRVGMGIEVSGRHKLIIDNYCHDLVMIRNTPVVTMTMVPSEFGFLVPIMK